MGRWVHGAAQIEAMLDRRELQRVAGGADAALALLGSADKHVATAARALPHDSEGAYVLAYDAARKAARCWLTRGHDLPPAAGTSPRSRRSRCSSPAYPV